jgi:hypothetical protein
MQGAPKGNQFWKLRSKHGRDKLFATPELLWDAACEYFQWCEDTPYHEVEQVKYSPMKPFKGDDGEMVFPPNFVELPRLRPFTIQGMCLYLDCNVLFLNQFETSLSGKTDKLSKDFSIIISRIRETIYNQKFSGAAAGFFNANIIARDLGLQEKTNVTIQKVGKDLEDEIYE